MKGLGGQATRHCRRRRPRVDAEVDADSHDGVRAGFGNSRSGFSFRNRCALLASILLLLQGNPTDLRGIHFPILAAQAFVTPSEQGSRRRIHRQASPPITTTTTTTTTSLHFFSSILSNNPNNDDNNNGGRGPDLPLARYVDVSANYTLAHTPQDYIDLQEHQRLVCIGDVHGDLEALRLFLETAGVYDPSTDSWCGGNTVIVQCGDVLDRGMEELACYRLLSKLSQQALVQSGRVILLVGNHEALNAMGLFQSAFSDFEHEQTIGTAVDAILGPPNKWRRQYATNQPARWASYEPGGLLAHSLLRNMKVAVRVGSTVCVHAGLKPHHLKEHGGISGMNAAYRDWISLGDDLCPVDDEVEGELKGELQTESQQQQQQPTGLPPHGCNSPVVYNHHGNYETPRQPWIDAERRQRFYVETIPSFLQSTPQDPGPIWMRDYSHPHDAPPRDDAAGSLERELETTLTLVGAKRMVMGHTIQSRINGVMRGKAWRVDVGASKGCLGGTPEVLEVVCVRRPDGVLAEEVSVLVPPTKSQEQQHQQQQQQQQNAPLAHSPPPPPSSTAATTNSQHPRAPRIGTRIPANERLVDSFTQAALQMW